MVNKTGGLCVDYSNENFGFEGSVCDVDDGGGLIYLEMSPKNPICDFCPQRDQCVRNMLNVVATVLDIPKGKITEHRLIH